MLDSMNPDLQHWFAAFIVSGKRFQCASCGLFRHIPELNCEAVKGFCPRFHHYELQNYSPRLFLKDLVWNSHADPREGGLWGQISGWQAEDAEFHHYELQSWKILFGTATLTQEKAACEAKFLPN
jgi:hypothetical protein